MSPDIAMIVVLFMLLAIGVPVAFALGASSAVGIVLGLPLDSLTTLGSNTYNSMAKYPLIAIPLFILTGTLFERSGVAASLVKFMQALVGSRRGGLAIVAILVCIILGGMSGSGPADAAAVGLVMLPSMVKSGYDKGFVAALIASGSSTAILIPPSIALILYSIYVPGVDLRALFAAGLIPGIMMGAFIIVPALYLSVKNNWETEHFERPNIKDSFIESLPALFAPVIILGGLRSGLFTPTEAAVVAATYGIIVGCFVYRTINLKILWNVFEDSAVITGSIFIILALAGVFAWTGTALGTFDTLAHAMIAFSDKQWVVLLLIMVVILIAGMFLDAISIFLILIPILIPVIKHFHWNVVWFGILVTINIAMGQFTPPVAINLMVTSKIADIGLEKTIAWIFYFLFAVGIVLLLVMIFPSLALWLPNALGYSTGF